MKFRTKPVEIEAERYKEGMEDGFEKRYTHYLNPGRSYGIQTSENDVEVQAPYIETLEGRHLITNGDWIITCANGERALCKPDIFEMTYDKVD